MRWQWWGGANTRPRNRLRAAVLAGALCLYAADARADSLRLRADGQYTGNETTVTNKITGDTVDSSSSRFLQRYRLDFSRDFYPNLSLLGGAYYELTDAATTTNGIDSESGERFLRPYFRLALNTPLYLASAEYRRTQIETEATGAPDLQNDREEFDTVLGWRPLGLPEFTLRYNQRGTTDNQDTRDQIEKTMQFETAYDPGKNLRLYYFYERDQSENRIRDTQTVSQRHNGRVDYSRRFLDNRLSMGTGYQFTYFTQALPINVDVATQITPAQGLSAIDDTPTDGPALAVNNALIDGNLTASAGLDIGLNGDETTLVNIGVDFGIPLDVDRIRIWVDQRLTATVSNSFAWEVYTSPDNLDTSTWTLAATVLTAPFGTFENRFEITFPALTTRYIKVVTRPLSNLVPGAAVFPNIFITEMETFVTRSGENAEAEQKTVDHNLSFNLTGRVSKQTSVGYDMFYRQREEDFAFESVTSQRAEVTNGLFFRHAFNPIFTTSARVQRSDTNVNDEQTVEWTYNAAVRADYLPVFNQSLTFSGTQTDAGVGTNSNQSVFLRNNAILYQGWSAFLDAGYNWSDTFGIGQEQSTTFRFGSNLEPHRTLTINLDASLREVTRPDNAAGDFTETQYNLQAQYVPFPALSLFGKISTRNRLDITTTVQNYAVNWAPFPGGALQFSLNYSEVLRPEEDRLDRSFGPFIKWTVSRHLLLEAQYTRSYSETATQDIETNSVVTELTFLW